LTDAEDDSKLSNVAMNDEYTKEGSRQKDDQSYRRNDDNEHQQQTARANLTNDADRSCESHHSLSRIAG
jgi:hypothetical protein